MSEDLPALRLACVMVLGLCALFARDCLSGAHAQDRTERETVARCLVAEAAPGDDYPAILSVLSRRSGSLEWAARHYCALYVARHPSARQEAIRALPGGPSARLYARHWRAALAAVDAWERGERSTCGADHFGDRLADARRARRAGWQRVDCGRTQNSFWLGRTSARAARGGHR